MKRQGLRILSLLLSVLTAVGMLTALPITASAAEGGAADEALLDEQGYYFNEETRELTLKWLSGLYTLKNNLDEFGEIDHMIVRETARYYRPEVGYYLPGSAFEDMTTVKKVTLEGSLDKIIYGCFDGCTALEKVVFPEGVTEIGSYAFRNCDALRTIEIPATVTKIESQAFENCDALETVTIPAAVTEIGADAFSWCDGLQTVVFEDADDAVIPTAKQLTIGDEAFYDCTALRELHLPRRLAAVGDVAFLGCNGLKTVVFPETALEGQEHVVLGERIFEVCGVDIRISVPEAETDYFRAALPESALLINAAADFRLYPVEVNGEIFRSDKLEIACGDGWARFDPATATLTLHNARLTKNNWDSPYLTIARSRDSGYSSRGGCAVDTELPQLTLVLEGANTFGNYSEAWGVIAAHNLTVTGGGSLSQETTGATTTYLTVRGDMILDGVSLTGVSIECEGSGVCVIRDCEIEAESIETRYCGEVLFENSALTIDGVMLLNYHYYYDNIETPKPCAFTIRQCEIVINRDNTGYAGAGAIDLYDDEHFTLTIDASDIVVQRRRMLDEDFTATDKITLTGGAEILEGDWTDLSGIHIGFAEPPEKTYTVTVDGVGSETADAVVTLKSGDREWTAERREDGSFVTEASNAEDVTLTVSAAGYVPRSFTRAKGTQRDWRLGAVRLYACPESGVITTHLTASDGTALTGFDRLNLSLHDDDRRLVEGEDYTLAYPYILLTESYRTSVRAVDMLTVLIRPDEETTHWTSRDANVNLTDRELTATVDVWGRLRLTVDSDFDGMNNVSILYRGNVIESGVVRSGETYVSQELHDRYSYKILVYNDNPMIGCGATEETLMGVGWEYGVDYVTKYFDGSSGKDIEERITVPVLDLDRNAELMDAANCRVTIPAGSVHPNTSFYARVQYAFADADTTDGELLISLPEGVSVESVSMDNRLFEKDTDYTEDYEQLTVRVGKAAGVVYLTLNARREGSYVVAAAARRGDAVKPFGSATVTVTPELTLIAPRTIDTNVFSVRVEGNAQGLIYFYIDGKYTGVAARANSAGTATAELTLPQKPLVGSEIIVSAESGGSKDEATVSVIGTKSKVENLYFQAVCRSRSDAYYIIKNGETVARTYYSTPPNDEDDRWIFVAELRGAKGSLQTNDVDLVLLLTDDNVEWIRMKLVSQESHADGSATYTFKGVYVQHGYASNQPVPKEVALAYNDISAEGYPLDTEAELDWEALCGTKEANEEMRRLLEEMQTELGSLTVSGECDRILEVIEENPQFATLTPDQLKYYTALRGGVDPQETEPDFDWMFNGSFILSTQAGFDAISEEEQQIILEYEAVVKQQLKTMAAMSLLTKPLYEYGSAEAALKELGVTVTNNYTGKPNAEYVQLDKNTWDKYDEKNYTESVIDTAEKRRVDIDYKVMEKRYNDVNAALAELIAADDNAVGILDNDDGVRGIAEELHGQLKEVIHSPDNPLDEVTGRARDYVIGNGASAVEDALGKLAKNYEKFSDAAVVDSFFKAVDADSNAAIGNCTRQVERSAANLNTMGVVQKGFKFVGNAMNVKGLVEDGFAMGKTKLESNDLRSRKENISKLAAEAMTSGYLTYDEALELNGYANDAKHAIDSMLFGNDVQNRYRLLSFLGTATWNPYIALGYQGLNESILGPDVIRVRAERGALEQMLDINERRMMELIARARKRKDSGKKKPYLYPDWKETLNLYARWQLGDFSKPVTQVVDPSGVVYEALEDNVLQGVTATLWYSPNEDGSDAEIWNAADYDQENPLITGELGYAWDVPKGWWQVRFEKEGYAPAQTDWLPVPPPQLNLKTAMVSAAKPEVETAAAYPDYLELTFTQYMDSEAAVRAEGWEAQWADIAESPDGKQLSKTLRLFPQNGAAAVGDSASLLLTGAKNYAGTALDNYAASLTVMNRPAGIELDTDAAELLLGDTVTLTAVICGADGKPLTDADVEVMSDESLADVTVTDKNGAYRIAVTGKDIGAAELTLRVKNTAVTAEIPLTVYGALPELPEPTLIGDVNLDGKVDITDATYIQMAIAKMITLDERGQAAADTNGDGKVDITDATYIQMYIAKMLDHLGK